MLIPCYKAELTGVEPDQDYVLTGPLTVIDQPVVPKSDDPKNVPRVDVSIFALLSGGVGMTEIQMEVRYSSDDRSYRTIGWSPVIEVGFTTENRGVSTLNLHFEFPKLPVKSAGLYEFRFVTPSGEELPGQRGEIRILSETW